MRPARPALVTFLIGGVTTLVVAFDPIVGFAHRSPAGHVALATFIATAAFLAAFLLLGRFLVSARLDDLLAGSALAVLAFSDLTFSAIPHAIAGSAPLPTADWASLFGATIGALVLASSAFVARIEVASVRRALTTAASAFAALVIGIAVVTVALEAQLPSPVPANISADASTRALLAGPVLGLVGQAVSVLFWGIAAVGFLRRARRSGDELMAWLAAAAVAGTLGRVNYFLFPSLSTAWVYTGDFFRLASYALVLIGAAYEIQAYWARLAEAAVEEERRRIARELHDGLAQELAYITAESEGPIAAAAARALDESRRAIAALSRPIDEPLDVALAQAAEEVAYRLGAAVTIRVTGSVKADAETREALIRVVREAVANAVRHGRAGTVAVELSGEDGLRLRVDDDGAGFEPERLEGSGFGLRSMRERVEALGGRFVLQSVAGAGTRVEICLP